MTSETSGESYDKATEFYKENRELARQHGLSSQQSLDKMLLLLITGVFVLSVNVVFNKDLDFVYTCLLITAWILLSVAIISQIVGYIYARLQAEDQVEKIDRWHDSWKNSVLILAKAFEPPRRFSREIKYTNYTTVIAFIFSLLIILVFSIINFLSMNEVKKTASQESLGKAAESNLGSYSPFQSENARVENADTADPENGVNEPAGEEKK